MISPGKVPIVKLIDFSQSCVRDNPKPPFIPRCKRNVLICINYRVLFAHQKLTKNIV